MSLQRACVGALFAILSFNSIASDWTFKKSDDVLGIKVFVRDVLDSKYKEFKAVTQVKSTLGGVVSLLADSDNTHNWIDNMRSNKVLKRSGSTSISYSVTHSKGIISARDNIVQSSLDQDWDTNAVTIAFKGRPDYLPEVDGVVRVPYVNGKYVLTPKANGWVEVVFQVHVNPGGRIPAFLYNLAIAKSPLNTLAGMHQQMYKYNGKTMEAIDER